MINLFVPCLLKPVTNSLDNYYGKTHPNLGYFSKSFKILQRNVSILGFSLAFNPESGNICTVYNNSELSGDLVTVSEKEYAAIKIFKSGYAEESERNVFCSISDGGYDKFKLVICKMFSKYCSNHSPYELPAYYDGGGLHSLMLSESYRRSRSANLRA